MNKKIIVQSIRYFETRRGLGYEAKTNLGSIWNDGNGGCTYFEPAYHMGLKNSDFDHLTEDYLENLLNIFEGV
tara:strand:- start:303 stop:521 length:219 start_codon:yes stop_codon:yes gene_type:complete